MVLAECIALVVGCAGVFFIVNYFKELLRHLKLMEKLPGPKRTPILGNIPDFICDEVDFFKKLREWSVKYEPMYSIAASKFYPSLNISGAEEFEAIASTMKNLEKGRVYFFLSRWLGEGLLTSTGSKWQTRRKILTPAFHFTILQDFITVFNNETERLVEVLRKETDKPSSNIIPLIAEFTLFTMAESSMGTKLNLEAREDKKYFSAINKIGHTIYYRSLRPWLYRQFVYYYFNTKGREELKLIHTLHKFTNDIILEKSTLRKFEGEQKNYNYSQRKKLAFLDLLLDAKMSKGIIDDEGIRDEVNTFMFEGYDTTSTAICFTLMLLANYKNWQDLVYQEIIEVLGDLPKNPSMNDLNELKIMERVIKESLRLYPSVPFIARMLEEETVLNDFVLPKDTSVNIHIYDIHRNPKYWSEPEKFDPDRFLPDNCVNRHPFAFVPFSAGPRNCIGQKFAMFELKAVLCGILRNFNLKPIDTPETIHLIPHMILRTKNMSLRVKFEPRHI